MSGDEVAARARHGVDEPTSVRLREMALTKVDFRPAVAEHTWSSVQALDDLVRSAPRGDHVRHADGR